jgi:dTDP-4-dehydrorhamnose reductase
MIRVLVTGAHSQLAQALAYTYIQADFKGYQVVFEPKQVLDITNLKQLDAYLQVNLVDYVINCAAYTQVDQAEQDREKAFAANVLGPGYLASLAQQMNFTLFHISTDYVFGGAVARPYTEDMPTNPTNYYGQTKLMGEQKVLAENPGAYIIRTSWLYGAVGNNFLTRFLTYAPQKETINMAYDQIGSPTYADDLARTICNMIKQHNQAPEQYLPGIYHYANEGVASRYDFAWAISQYMGLACQLTPGSSKDFPQLAQRPAYSVLGKEKIKQAFGMKIPHWQESLALCIRNWHPIT